MPSLHVRQLPRPLLPTRIPIRRKHPRICRPEITIPTTPSIRLWNRLPSLPTGLFPPIPDPTRHPWTSPTTNPQNGTSRPLSRTSPSSADCPVSAMDGQEAASLNSSQNRGDRDPKPATQSPSTGPFWIRFQDPFILFLGVSDFGLQHTECSTVFPGLFWAAIAGLPVLNDGRTAPSGARLGSSFLTPLHPSQRGDPHDTSVLISTPPPHLVRDWLRLSQMRGESPALLSLGRSS